VQFEGTESYVATGDLAVSVNAAITLQRPLLIKGKPGTGKAVLAAEIAKALGKRLTDWTIKSTTKAQHGLYETAPRNTEPRCCASRLLSDRTPSAAANDPQRAGFNTVTKALRSRHVRTHGHRLPHGTPASAFASGAR